MQSSSHDAMMIGAAGAPLGQGAPARGRPMPDSEPDAAGCNPAIGGGEAGAPARELVTVSEAARQLGIDKSVVSRQVRKLGIAKDRTGRFGFDEYVARRERELNPMMARGGGMADPASPAARAGANETRRHDVGAVNVGQNANNELKRLQAQKLQLELAERAGDLIDRAAVTAQLQTATRTLRDTLLGLPNRLAGDLASMTDVAEIKTRLDAEIRKTLETLAAGFAELAAPENEPRESEAA